MKLKPYRDNNGNWWNVNSAGPTIAYKIASVASSMTGNHPGVLAEAIRLPVNQALDAVQRQTREEMASNKPAAPIRPSERDIAALRRCVLECRVNDQAEGNVGNVARSDELLAWLDSWQGNVVREVFKWMDDNPKADSPPPLEPIQQDNGGEYAITGDMDGEHATLTVSQFIRFDKDTHPGLTGINAGGGVVSYFIHDAQQPITVSGCYEIDTHGPEPFWVTMPQDTGQAEADRLYQEAYEKAKERARFKWLSPSAWWEMGRFIARIHTR